MSDWDSDQEGGVEGVEFGESQDSSFGYDSEGSNDHHEGFEFEKLSGEDYSLEEDREQSIEDLLEDMSLVGTNDNEVILNKRNNITQKIVYKSKVKKRLKLGNTKSTKGIVGISKRDGNLRGRLPKDTNVQLNILDLSNIEYSNSKNTRAYIPDISDVSIGFGEISKDSFGTGTGVMDQAVSEFNRRRNIDDSDIESSAPEDILNSKAVLEDWLLKSLSKPELKTFLEVLKNPVKMEAVYTEHLNKIKDTGGINSKEFLSRSAEFSKMFSSPMAWSNALFEGIEIGKDKYDEPIYELQNIYTGTTKNKKIRDPLKRWAEDMLDAHVPEGTGLNLTEGGMRVVIGMGGKSLQRKLQTNHNTTWDKLGKHVSESNLQEIDKNIKFLSEIYTAMDVTEKGREKSIEKNSLMFIKHFTKKRLPARKVIDLVTGKVQLDERGEEMFATQILPNPNEMDNMMNITTHNSLPKSAGFQGYKGVMRQQSKIDVDMDGDDFWNKSLHFRQSQVTSINKTLGLAIKGLAPSTVMPDNSEVTVKNLNILAKRTRDLLQKEMITNADIAYGRSKASVSSLTVSDEEYANTQEYRNEAAILGLSMEGIDQADLVSTVEKKSGGVRSVMFNKKRSTKTLNRLLGSITTWQNGKMGKVYEGADSMNTDGRASSYTGSIHASGNSGMSESELYQEFRKTMSEEEAYKETMIHTIGGARTEKEFIGPIIMSDIDHMDSVNKGLKSIGKLHEQKTKEWFKQKFGRVSATTFNRLKTSGGNWSTDKQKKEAVQRAMILKGYDMPEFEGNAMMGVGDQHEDTVKKKFEAATGYKTRDGYWTEGVMEGTGASPDGYVFDEDGTELGMLEIKVHTSEKAYEAGAKTYYDQMQWQMYQSGREQTFFANMLKNDPDSLYYDVVGRDETRIAELILIAEDQIRMTNELTEGEVLEEMLIRGGSKNLEENRKRLKERNENKAKEEKSFIPKKKVQEEAVGVFGKVDNSKSPLERFSRNPSGSNESAVNSDIIMPSKEQMGESVSIKKEIEKEAVKSKKKVESGQNKSMKDLEKAIKEQTKIQKENNKLLSIKERGEGFGGVAGSLVSKMTVSKTLGALTIGAEALVEGNESKVVDLKLQSDSGIDHTKIRKFRKDLQNNLISRVDSAALVQGGADMHRRFSGISEEGITEYAKKLSSIRATSAGTKAFGAVHSEQMEYSNFQRLDAMGKQQAVMSMYQGSMVDEQTRQSVMQAFPTMKNAFLAVDNGYDPMKMTQYIADEDSKYQADQIRSIKDVTSGADWTVSEFKEDAMEWVADNLGETAVQIAGGAEAILKDPLGGKVVGGAIVGGGLLYKNRKNKSKLSTALKKNYADLDKAKANTAKAKAKAGVYDSHVDTKKNSGKVKPIKKNLMKKLASKLGPKVAAKLGLVGAGLTLPVVGWIASAAGIASLAYDVVDSSMSSSDNSMKLDEGESDGVDEVVNNTFGGDVRMNTVNNSNTDISGDSSDILQQTKLYTVKKYKTKNINNSTQNNSTNLVNPMLDDTELKFNKIEPNSLTATQVEKIKNKETLLNKDSGTKSNNIKVEVSLDDSVVLTTVGDEFGNRAIETTPYHLQ